MMRSRLSSLVRSPEPRVRSVPGSKTATTRKRQASLRRNQRGVTRHSQMGHRTKPLIPVAILQRHPEQSQPNSAVSHVLDLLLPYQKPPPPPTVILQSKTQQSTFGSALRHTSSLPTTVTSSFPWTP